MLTYEDDIADTLRPRFELCGGDPARIHLLNGVASSACFRDGEKFRMFRLADDATQLRNILTDRPDIRLVIIDPLNGYFGSKHDSFRDNEVREVLQPYTDLAKSTGVCIVLNTHFTKHQGEVIHRFLNSVGIVGIVRIALAVMKDPTDPDRRVILPAKSNVGPDNIGLAYSLTGPRPGICRPDYEPKPVEMTAQEFADQQSKRPPLRELACDWLLVLLKNGPLPLTDVRRKAELAGHSWRTIERAKGDLGIISEKPPGSSQLWRLPPTPPNDRHTSAGGGPPPDRYLATSRQ